MTWQWWALWVLLVASAALNWWQRDLINRLARIVAAFRCDCGEHLCKATVHCTHIGGWHHGPVECLPMHEEIP